MLIGREHFVEDHVEAQPGGVRAEFLTGQGGASKLSLGNLPPAMLQKAASRLSWVALVCAGVAVAMPFVQHALQPEVAQTYKQLSVQINTAALAACRQRRFFRWDWHMRCSSDLRWPRLTMRCLGIRNSLCEESHGWLSGLRFAAC